MKRFTPDTYPAGDTRVNCVVESERGRVTIHQRPSYSFQDARDTAAYMNERTQRHAQPLLAPGALAK